MNYRLILVLAFIILVSMAIITSRIMPKILTTDSPRIQDSAPRMPENFDPQSLEQVKKLNPFRTKQTITSIPVLDCDHPRNSAKGDQLVSTAVLEDHSKSLVIIRRSSGDVKYLREGQLISEDTEVYQIQRKYILVKNLKSQVCEKWDLINP